MPPLRRLLLFTAKCSRPQLRSRSRDEAELGLVDGQPLHQRGEVVAGELPVEGLGDLAPVVLEGVERAREGGEVWEVVGLEHLPLDDREVDLDLVEASWRAGAGGRG